MRRAFAATAGGLAVALTLAGLLPAGTVAAAPRTVPTAFEKLSAVDFQLQAVDAVADVYRIPKTPGVNYVVGDAITFTATVTESQGRAPRGTVSFSAPGATRSACQKVAVFRNANSWIAWCHITYAQTGTFTVSAQYVGADKSHRLASERITVSPEYGNIRGAVVTPWTQATDVYFSAYVDESSILDPGGTVEFSSDGLACSANVVDNTPNQIPGYADCNVFYSRAGTYQVTATLHAANGLTAATSFTVDVSSS
ncbi:MAG: Ig-like domain repeat protein [Acidimicrobiales bacterium]|jgi:hypothetical protein